MAERRMFAKTIIDSDAFLDMPISARLLYYDLGMRADDDGFVNAPKKIMRMIGASMDDMNILIARKFVLTFDTGVVVIKHWRIHNYIQKDRYIETKYKEEKSLLNLDHNNSYTFNSGIPAIEKKPLTEAQQKRYDAKKESSLPYSFEYKIRNAFVGEKCPICNCKMDYSCNLTKPTIQHNIPISKGGKHELDNISVICMSCNTSIQNRETTPPLNTKLVKEKWYEIENGVGMYTQVRLGKYSIDKYNVDDNIYSYYENNIGSITPRQYEIISNYINDFNEDIIKEAINRASDNNAKTFKYIEGILKSWKAKGYKTLGEIQNEKKTKKEKDIPEWIDKNIQLEELDKEEQAKLEKEMEIFV